MLYNLHRNEKCAKKHDIIHYLSPDRDTLNCFNNSNNNNNNNNNDNNNDNNNNSNSNNQNHKAFYIHNQHNHIIF